jgi:hypothetical protein
VKRSDVLEAAVIAAAVADNENRPDWQRVEAEQVYRELADQLLHTDDPEKRVRLVPLGFRIRNFYRDVVVRELLDRLPELESEQPCQVLMARQAAEICDCDSYSKDFRIESWKALEAVLKSLDPPTLTAV